MAASEVKERVPISHNQHLPSRRGLALILHGERLTTTEIGHLEQCATCNEWLVTFTGLARKAGFPITFRIPPRPLRSAKHADTGAFYHSQTSHAESMT
jgi:hypothetical protein